MIDYDNYFLVGDTVTVRRDIEPDHQYFMDDMNRSDVAIRSMIALAGKRVTIASSGYKYTLEGEKCWWTDEMFEEYLPGTCPKDQDAWISDIQGLDSIL